LAAANDGSQFLKTFSHAIELQLYRC